MAVEFVGDADRAAGIDHFLKPMTFLNLKGGTPLGDLPELILYLFIEIEVLFLN